MKSKKNMQSYFRAKRECLRSLFEWHGARYQQNAPFVPSLLVEFRKRLTEEVLNEINEMIIDYNKSYDQDGNVGGGDNSEDSSECR